MQSECKALYLNFIEIKQEGDREKKVSNLGTRGSGEGVFRRIFFKKKT